MRRYRQPSARQADLIVTDKFIVGTVINDWPRRAAIRDLTQPLDPKRVRICLSLALQCQLRVMADTAWIGDTHTKVGRLGSAHNLYAALPRTTAAYLTLCNGKLTADECYRQAIVNKVVPREKLMATCEEMAEMICDSSPLAVQAAVRLYRLTAAFDPSLVSYARQLDQEIAESEDGAEGPRAFREKRKPVWKMR